MKKNIVLLSFNATIVITLVIATFFIMLKRDSSVSAPSVSLVNGSEVINKPQGPVSKDSKAPTIDDNDNTKQIRQARVGNEITTINGDKASIKKYRLLATPNDPNSGQWWESTLDTINTVWDLPTPKKQTLIAIVDTGFAMDHEEFSGRLFTNPGETGTSSQENPSDLNCTDQALPIDMACNNVDDNVDGIIDNESGVTTYENPSFYNCTDQAIALDKNCNLIDDDANGLIDDVSGWDFVNSDSSPQAGELNEADNVNTYHGTMVAGIVGANANNNVGIAGVDWNSTILPLQALDDDGYGDSITVGNAIKYAADMNADVINLSLGTDTPDIIILQAVEYAHSKGSIVVASAGNDGCDCMVYPAKYDITLSVGASNQSGERSSFSSYGSTLDIVAPGSSILTSSYNSTNKTSLYQYGSGTSFSAPMVSGLVSLIKAQHPDSTPTQLAAIVTEMANKTINGGQHKTNATGYGRVSFSETTNRAINPLSFEQIYKFTPITNGGVFYGIKNTDVIYACESGGTGTTPIYKSTNSKYFYSINHTDLRYADNNGYNNAAQLSGCILMPHDIVQTAREINLNSEISNGSYKSLLDF